VKLVSGAVTEGAKIKNYYLESHPASLFHITESIASDTEGQMLFIYTKGNVSLQSTSSFGWSESGSGRVVNVPLYNLFAMLEFGWVTAEQMSAASAYANIATRMMVPD
jgi:uncharacterized protein YdgA (DUF945 family)